MPDSLSRSRRVLALALFLGAFLSACGGEPDLPTALTADEERLVDEVLQLIEVRITRARDEDEAESKRQALPPLLAETEIQGILDELARHPERGQLVVGAIHDSLTARRERLLRPPRDPR